MALSPSSNNINNLNKANGESSPHTIQSQMKRIGKGKKSAEKEILDQTISPPEEHIQIYFSQKGWPQIEAEKFYSHYQSNG